MQTYSNFARVYSAGSYPEYSKYIARKLPDILGKLDHHPTSILDLGCGEGSFAIEASKLGFEVTGVDKSAQMIKIARQKATNNSKITFLEGDMRSLALDQKFDLVTSWFDSMNYLLTLYDFRQALKTAYEQLKKGGFFVFDVNTIFGLSVQWQEQECDVQRDDSDLFEIHRTSYDPARQIASLKITVFQRNCGGWEKWEEVHKERGYKLTKIKELAKEVGFTVKAIWDDLDKFSGPNSDSGRVWIALYRG